MACGSSIKTTLPFDNFMKIVFPSWCLSAWSYKLVHSGLLFLHLKLHITAPQIKHKCRFCLTFLGKNEQN